MSTKKKAVKKEKPSKEPSKAEVAKQEKESHGLAIVKATNEGITLAKKAFGSEGLTEGLGKALSHINEKITVTATGLKVKAGYHPTEEEITKALAGLCGINEETAKFKTTTTWAIGDAALLAEKLEGGADRVVVQAVSERGISKHTVQQALAVCRDFPHGDRIAGLSLTHHQELRNYRDGIKNKKAYEELVDSLRSSAKKDEAPSCAELREQLQELSGKAKKDKNGAPEKEHTFLMISEDSEVTKSEGLDKALCKAGRHLVIDITEMVVMKGDGSVFYSIPDHVEETAPDPVVEPKKAPAKKSKVEVPA